MSFCSMEWMIKLKRKFLRQSPASHLEDMKSLIEDLYLPMNRELMLPMFAILKGEPAKTENFPVVLLKPLAMKISMGISKSILTLRRILKQRSLPMNIFNLIKRQDLKMLILICRGSVLLMINLTLFLDHLEMRQVQLQMMFH